MSQKIDNSFDNLVLSFSHQDFEKMRILSEILFKERIKLCENRQSIVYKMAETLREYELAFIKNLYTFQCEEKVIL